MDFKAINRAALSAYPGILMQWLPGGRKNGNEYVCSGLSGRSGGSLSVNIKTGMWADFATGEKGGDAISLYAAINRLDQGTAAKYLGTIFGGGENIPVKKETPQYKIIQPALNPAPQSAFLHWKFGKPSNIWTYLDKDKNIMGYVCRFDLADGSKETWPLVFTDKGWKWKSFDKPRCLYNLDKLALLKPDRQVMIVEGEKCADAAMKIFPGLLTVTWPGGGKAATLADWRPLAGREVIIWPDRDIKYFQGNHELAGQLMSYVEQPGTITALKIAEILTEIGCKVRIIDVSSMIDVKDGWDVADAVAEGWDKPKLLAWMKKNAKLYALPASEYTDLPHEQKKSNVISMALHPAAQAKPKTEKPKKPAAVTDVNKMTFATGNEWQRFLSFRDLDKPVARSVHNAKIFFTHHPEMKGVFWLNTFTRNIEMRKCPAWKNPKTFKPCLLEDTDDTEAKSWLERSAVCRPDFTSGITISISETRAAIAAVAAKNPFNPLQDWLGSIQWDNEPRLDKWLSTYLGVENSPYSSSVGRKFLIGSIARALNPGCKMDTMLILEGPQGLKKSTAIEVLFSEDFFTDEIERVGSKDTAMQMLGRWVIEIAELDALERAEVKMIKAWMSRKSDKFRPPYGRSVIVQPRSCVLFGTVNPEGGYLRDATGGRRFWPVKCGNIDIPAIQADREQLWAEAVHEYYLGEQWWLTNEEIKIAQLQQEDRYESDPWADDINRFINHLNYVTTSDIMRECLDIPKERKNRPTEMRIGKHLTSLGWTRKKIRNSDQVLVWKYFRPDETGQQLNLMDSVPL